MRNTFERGVAKHEAIADFVVNNYSVSPRWIRDGKWPTRRVAPSCLLTISYPTRPYGIIVFVNSHLPFAKF